ncbi:SNF2-related protein [Coprothermobacter platensis]|uniref:SNF2-related protein n=1 Tax=Coprothermobacter platensis TaxID=108819 RepID=UPI000380A5A1|nr:SNF2-related protein [Coprothermobacter platensis]
MSIKRFTSREKPLLESFLNPNLIDAQRYDRLAGYFSSSVLEVAGEAIESVQNGVRVICNSHVEPEDVQVARLVEQEMLREFRQANLEKHLPQMQSRFQKLYDLLSSGKLDVRVVPQAIYGLAHGKAGVITRKDGSKVAFLGSMNETKPGWAENYELLWADESEDAVEWVQKEFDYFWNNELSVPLSKAVEQEIERLAKRQEISLADWRANQKREVSPCSVVIESPFYKRGDILWNHQKHFIKMAFEDHVSQGGARYILADEVGLGKTTQLAIIAELIALYDDKPVLIIVPKPLVEQWQDELNSMWSIPSAAWTGRGWHLEDGTEDRDHDIGSAPRKIAIISQGMVVHSGSDDDNSPSSKLLRNEYAAVIVDEAHKARVKEPTDPYSATPNNLMAFLNKISLRTKTMIFATATPIQLDPAEIWHLLYALAGGDGCKDENGNWKTKDDRPFVCQKVLGDASSRWLRNPKEAIEIITGKYPQGWNSREAWNWMRNPLPPASEHPLIGELQTHMGLRKNEVGITGSNNRNISFDNLDPIVQGIVDQLVRERFFENYNPFIRCIVRRRREMLETTIDPSTGKFYLTPIKVNFVEGQENGLHLTPDMEKAYLKAIEFTNILGGQGAKGFYRVLLLRRLGSSIEAGLNSAERIYYKRAISTDMLTQTEQEDIEDFEELQRSASGFQVQGEEMRVLEDIIKLLKGQVEKDPKYTKIKELLSTGEWEKRGCLIFSQYYDTARAVARSLSEDFPDRLIGLYSGTANGSGLFKGGAFQPLSRNDVKDMVTNRQLRFLVGTDAAGEGLNFQMLGSLINVDLPWNPVRLEQRIGRLRREGQVFDDVWVYNLYYAGTIEEEVQRRILERIMGEEKVIGRVNSVLPEELMKILRETLDEEGIGDESKHPFELKYRQHLSHVDFETCPLVINDDERRQLLMQGWENI